MSIGTYKQWQNDTAAETLCILNIKKRKHVVINALFENVSISGNQRSNWDGQSAYPGHLDHFYSRSHGSSKLNKNYDDDPVCKSKIKSAAYKEKSSNKLISIATL